MTKEQKETLGAWVWTLALAGGFILLFRRMTANRSAQAQSPYNGGSGVESKIAETDITGGEVPNAGVLQDQWLSGVLGNIN